MDAFTSPCITQGLVAEYLPELVGGSTIEIKRVVNHNTFSAQSNQTQNYGISGHFTTVHSGGFGSVGFFPFGSAGTKPGVLGRVPLSVRLKPDEEAGEWQVAKLPHSTEAMPAYHQSKVGALEIGGQLQ